MLSGSASHQRSSDCSNWPLLSCFDPALFVVKLPFPRSVKAWLVATVSLTAVALVSIAPMMRPRAQSLPTTYTITDLGAFGGVEAKAFAINSCGQIAGYATLAGESKRPFFRPASSLINLGVLSGDGAATSLNNSGQVVGYSPSNGSTHRAFIWHDDNGNNVSDSGEMKEILPIGRTGSAEDVNDNGRVVGWVLSDGTSGGTGGFEGFTWDPNQNPNFQIISGSPAHGSPKLYGINNSGAIVGENSDSRMGFILRNGIFTDIPAFGTGIKSVAYAVSELEHVVGAAALNNFGTPTMHAIIWTDAGPTPGLKDLGTLTGKTHSFAYSVAIVDGSVQVVGSSNNNLDLSDARAFIWQDLNDDGDGIGVEDVNEMKYLWDLIPATDQAEWTVLQEAYSINSSGQIVGYGLRNGDTRAFLLTPTGVSQQPCLPNVNVSVSPSAMNEDAAGSLTYTFTRSIVTASTLTVNFSLGGTADPSTDYGQTGATSFTPPTGTVTFAGGSGTATVTVDPTTDFAVEPSETVVLTTTAGPGYNVGTPTSATGTINTDDTNVSVSVSPSSVFEDGATTLVYTFTRTGLTNAITVNFSLTGSTATLDSDYVQSGNAGSFTSSGGTINFGSGETVKQITVNPTTDAFDEPNETVIMTVTSGTGYTAGSPSVATGTITDDDDPPSISINNVTQSEGNSGTSSFVFTVSLSKAAETPVTLDYMISAGSTNPATGGALCAAGLDFENKSGTITFDPSDTSKQVSIVVCGDTSVEPDETFFVNLSNNSSNATLLPGTKGTGTITNDDTDVTLSVSPSSVTESDSDSLVYTFTRAGVTTGALTVNFSVAGTATLNTDYTQSGAATFSSSAGTVTLPAGISSATVTLAPTPDFIHEGDETATLTVTTGTGYNVGSPSTQQGTITDDDPTPTIQITSVTAPESSSATSFVFTVSLTNPSASQIDVNYATATTGATTPATGGPGCNAGIDYVDAADTLSFAPGETSKQVNVTVCSDGTLEPDETFFVNLSGNTNSNLPAGTKGTGTITPQVPVLWTEEAGPSCPSGTCLAAIDSVTFVRGPFKLTNNWNLTPSDRATRIILFTSNLGMTNANLPSGILSVHINGSAIPLANIENVGTVAGVSGMDASYVIVKLPASLPAGSNTITVNMGSVASNVAILSIIP